MERREGVSNEIYLLELMKDKEKDIVRYIKKKYILKIVEYYVPLALLKESE